MSPWADRHTASISWGEGFLARWGLGKWWGQPLGRQHGGLEEGLNPHYLHRLAPHIPGSYLVAASLSPTAVCGTGVFGRTDSYFKGFLCCADSFVLFLPMWSIEALFTEVIQVEMAMEGAGLGLIMHIELENSPHISRFIFIQTSLVMTHGWPIIIVIPPLVLFLLCCVCCVSFVSIGTDRWISHCKDVLKIKFSSLTCTKKKEREREKKKSVQLAALCARSAGPMVHLVSCSVRRQTGVPFPGATTLWLVCLDQKLPPLLPL